MQFPSEFSEEIKKLLAFWHDIILERHKDDDDESPQKTPEPIDHVTNQASSALGGVGSKSFN
ncbi:10860_t:CDS:2 [Entrophospora sp. SA101]|nr:10860_t:CDS:2 [Entrophospora sp. SA101]